MSKELPPVSNSLWMNKKMQTFPELEEDLETEVCVIGGGIAGVATAFILAKRGIPVVLIEGGRVGGGTTGYTTAKITSQHGLKYADLIKTFGEEKAQLYYDANEDAIAWIERMSKKLDIDCQFERQPSYVYATTEEGKKELEKEAEAYQKLGLDGRMTDKHDLPFDVKASLVMHDQAQFHPLCFLSKLLRYLEVENMPIYENTRAVDIKRGKKPSVITENDNVITADHVVIATHYPFKDLQALYVARLHVERSYSIAVRLNGEPPPSMYLNAESPKRSLRRALDHEGKPLLLIGGEGHTSGQQIDTLQSYQNLRDYAVEHFDVASIPYRWSSQDVFTLDGVPYAGPMTPGKDDFFVATGFAKWGMTNGVAAAQIIADRIVDKRNPYANLYTPSRFTPSTDMKNVVKENMDVARTFVKGKLDRRSRKKPEELTSGEGAVVHVDGKRAGAYRDEKGKLTIVDTTCSHLGCELYWNNGEHSWDCPCHGSRFDTEGSVLEGPAVKPLKQLYYEPEDHS
ncbi:FAD-dependent oxidoreductase [Alkalicoccus halolimnae]|uniref:FAD-dependent oxidoreductase n=1 Tax=Alkalicoccus halolimnae TaxID=1667239 RepID=A0A5C7FNC0_9BACI|nr:FAD-dependent oxidoreductase [Alkalicoccus halolimnae]TXF86816.1 FAD-dependent oxidoreductase [Alkalicoccus halolimnae]